LGYHIFLITGGESEFIKKTYVRLGVTEVRLESSNKLQVFEEIKNKYELNSAHCLYRGDDIPDIPLLKNVGVAAAPQDASVDVKEVATYVSPYQGGAGCVRDVIEQTLRAQGKWLGPDAFTW
jgi:3-deoxy-D-manno-octulosonate 8-phosphate phosphatase (KDO 8-P phosphatase)